MKESADPMDELRTIKRKLSRELEAARKKEKLMEKLQDIERRTARLLQPRRNAHSP